MPVFTSLEQLKQYGDVVIDENDCWLWHGTLWGNGYARVGNKRMHRVAWEIANQESLGERLGLHSCDVKHCINPEHVWPGTQRENMHDMIAKGRKVVVSGDQHWMKTEGQKEKMRGGNHWTHRMPERLPRGDDHWKRKAMK